MCASVVVTNYTRALEIGRRVGADVLRLCKMVYLVRADAPRVARVTERLKTSIPVFATMEAPLRVTCMGSTCPCYRYICLCPDDDGVQALPFNEEALILALRALGNGYKRLLDVMRVAKNKGSVGKLLYWMDVGKKAVEYVVVSLDVVREVEYPVRDRVYSMIRTYKSLLTDAERLYEFISSRW